MAVTKNPTVLQLLLLAGALLLGACDFVRGDWVTRGQVTLLNNTNASLEISVQGQDEIQVASGADARWDTEWLRVNFQIRKDGELFLYRIPFDIWESRYTNGRARNLRLQIDDGMRVYLMSPDRKAPAGALSDQSTCFPLIPVGEWLRSDVRVHSVKPSRRSRYKYGTLPRPLGPPVGNGKYINDDVLGPAISIKVLLKDTDSGYVGSAIVDNFSFARSLWWLSQDDPGRRDFMPPPAEFIRDHYVPFMQEHEDRPIEIKLRAYADSFPLSWRGMCKEDSPADPFPRTEPYTLSELGFADRDELIDTLFNIYVGPGIRAQSRETVGDRTLNFRDKRFISLLIDFGLVVESVAPHGLQIRIFE